MTPPRFVLASGSPRRAAMLRGVGFEIELAPVDVDETFLPDEDGTAAARRLARAKLDAAQRLHPGAFVLAADTVVEVDGRPLGKPADRDEAAAMLRLMSGRWHEVMTGVALGTPGGARHEAVAFSRVRFVALTDAEIARYVSGSEPYDKAGGYALQGAAGWFVEAVEGSVSNIVGLPLALVRELAAEAGLPLPTLGGAPPSASFP